MLVRLLRESNERRVSRCSSDLNKNWSTLAHQRDEWTRCSHAGKLADQPDDRWDNYNNKEQLDIAYVCWELSENNPFLRQIGYFSRQIEQFSKDSGHCSRQA